MVKKIYVFLSIFLSLPYILEAKNITGSELKILLENWLNHNEIKSDFSILPEIKYPECDEILINNISKNFSLIKINCYSPKAWSFIVRNKLDRKNTPKKANKKYTKIDKKILEEQVLVLNKSIPKGTIITENDLVQKTIKKNEKLFYITEKEKIIGKRLKNSYQAGKPIKFSSLEKVWMIEKDSNITIENVLGGITIKVDGRALENADYLQKIKVMNSSSGEILDGYVLNKKKVTLKPKQF